MRAFALIATLTVLVPCADAQQASSERAAAYTLGQADIATITGPTRTTIVEIGVGGRSPRRQQVQIAGVISDVAINALLQLHLGADRRYRGETHEWKVEVIGDTRFARLTATLLCAPACAYVTTGMYSFDKGKWILLYGERVVA